MIAASTVSRRLDGSARGAKPRTQLAYLARDWSAMKATEIARRLHRDASMVSRLCANYEAAQDAKIEKNMLIDK
jgi:hypothetical protein